MKRHTAVKTYDNFLALMKSVNGEQCDTDEYGFSRSFEFSVFIGVSEFRAKCSWFHNLSTINLGDTEIMFTHASLDGGWPNGCSKNLNLSMDGERTHAALALRAK